MKNPSAGTRERAPAATAHIQSPNVKFTYPQASVQVWEMCNCCSVTQEQPLQAFDAIIQ